MEHRKNTSERQVSIARARDGSICLLMAGRSSSRYCAWNLSSECRSPTVAVTTSCVGHDSVMIGNELKCLFEFYFLSSWFIFVRVANGIDYYPTSKLMCIFNQITLIFTVIFSIIILPFYYVKIIGETELQSYR